MIERLFPQHRRHLGLITLTTCLVMLACAALTPQRALAYTIKKDGVASVERADCVFVGDHRNFTFETNAPSLFKHFTRINASNGYRYEEIGVVHDPKGCALKSGKERRSWGTDKWFRLVYDDVLLDSKGTYHDLTIEFSNISTWWEYDPQTGNNLQLLVSANPINGGDRLYLYADGPIRNASNGSIVQKHTEQGNAQNVQVSMSIRVWSDATLLYNMAFWDFDTQDYLTNFPSHGFDGPYAEGIRLVSGWPTNLHANKNTTLTVDGDRIRGTAGDPAESFADGTTALTANTTIGNSRSSALTFVWRADSCESAVFWDYTHLIRAKVTAGKGTISIRPGSSTANAVAKSTNATNATLKSVHKNDYWVTTEPAKGYKRTNLVLDDTNQNDPSVAAIKAITGDHQATAAFAPINYIVRYDKNADDATGTTGMAVNGYDTQRAITSPSDTSNTTSLLYDKTYAIENNGYVREGYTFLGFSLSPDGSPQYAQPSDVPGLISNFSNLTDVDGGVVTLYAQWRREEEPAPASWNLVFDKNADDATGETIPMPSLPFGEQITLSPNGFTRPEHTWQGWNTVPDGTGDTYEDLAVVSSDSFGLDPDQDDGTTVTLYAMWRPLPTYNVIFDANAPDATGETAAMPNLPFDEGQHLSPNGFERPGYAWAGWKAQDPASGTPFGDREAFTSSTFSLDPEHDNGATVVLYAQWVALSGSISLSKSPAEPSFVEGNSCYSLEGATFEVYDSEDLNNMVGTLICDELGKAVLSDVDPGDYWVRETVASKGYRLDEQIHKVSVSPSETAQVSSTEPPITANFDLLVRKVDAETARQVAQGDATLAGAEFAVLFYPGRYELDTLPEEPSRHWVVKTDEKGEARLDKTHLAGGDDLYTSGNGNVVLPLGTLTITETKAPEGYTMPEGDKTRIVQITDDITEAFDPIVVKEPVQRGGVRILKTDEAGLEIEGAEFAITNRSKSAVNVKGKSYEPGEVCLVITSDKDGVAATDANALPCGTYEVVEQSAPRGWLRNTTYKQTFSLGAQGGTIDLTEKPCVNKRATVEVTLEAQKSFDGTSQGLSLEPGQFTFLLTDGKGTVLQTAVNDATGKIRFNPLVFDIDDLDKDHKYRICEEAGTDELIVYDTHEEEVAITIHEGEDGALTAEVSTDDDGLVFHNETVPAVTLPQTGSGGVRHAATGATIALISMCLLVLRHAGPVKGIRP